MKDYSVLLSCGEATMLIIHDAFDKGYQQGYADAKSELGQKAIDLAHEESDRAYQRGLNEAWEVARKVASAEGLSMQELAQIFDTASFSRILENTTASEAIAKIKKYEEHQKQDIIQVGDEVFYMDENDLRVVVRISNQMDVVQITKDGKCAINDVEELHRTGRTFPQIAEVFTEMRGESE